MTTAKEAVENFKEAADKYTDTLKKKAPEIVRSLAGAFCDMKIRLMLNFAADATEKQIPKKPLPYKGFDGKCVCCGVVFLDRSTKYCGNCGQALDWGEAD